MHPTGAFTRALGRPRRGSAGRVGRLALSALAVGLVLLLLGATLPLVLGTQAQRAYQHLLGAAGAALPGATVIFSRYDRGWFRSTANTEWTLAASGTQRLRLDSRIEQGPFTWFSREGFPVLARVQTRAEWIGTAVELPPLLVTTNISTDGSAVGRLLVPATDQPRRDDIHWLRNTDLTGTVHFSPAAPTWLIAIDLPAVALVTPTGPLAQLTDARLGSELRGWTGGLYTGTTRLTIGAARFGGTGADPAASPATEPRRQRLPTGLPDTPPTAPGGAALHGLVIDLTQTPSDRNLDIQLQAQADDLQLRGQDYRTAQVGISARSLHGESLIDLIEAIQTLSSTTRTPALRGLVGLTLVTRLLPRFLAAGPRFDLDPVRLDTPDGPVNLHLRIAAPAAGDGGVNRGSNAVTWLTAITGEGAVTLPESVARDWLGPADQEHRDPAGHRLDRWLDEGWVSARDEQVSSTVRLADGVLTVNGRILPLLGPTGGFR
jgi:hypothetical protein